MEGVGKLIELLNEYELERENGIEEFKNWALPLWEWSIDDGDLVYDGVEPSMNLESAYGDTANGIVISKSYGFIKWLVDNNKINIDEHREEYSENNLYCNSDFFKLLEYYDVYESLLMTLAISDTPIQDICVWLK